MTARFAPAVVLRTSWPFAEGGFVLRSPMPEPSSARCVGDWLVRWATEAPQRTFLAERADGDWRRVSYGEALAQVRGLAQALLDAGLGPTAPVAVLSGNSIAHALLALAAMHVGVPVAPVSPAYSLASADHGKLRALIAMLAPGAVWAEGAAFDRAFAALGVSRFDVRAAEPTAAVDEAFAAIAPETVAKILFTSGSTGTPKGVVNTHRMLCANQAAIAAGWPFLDDRPPVIVDWLPWSHTFGANHNFNMILAHGGTLYIDGGKPAPGAFDTTLANLREVPSTLYFNVPRGFDMLVAALETDDALRETFFRDLDIVFYAAAALSPATWGRLAAVAKRAGKSPAMVSAWGSTETSPLVTQVHFPIDRAGVIGLPAPGLTLAFVPSGDKLEMRVKGPSVTPGYWIAGGGIEPAPRDAHGFYPMGDAGRLADPSEPARGVVFDGRTAENFKLTSGTWVHVGELRIALVAACSPFVADAVITGHDRDEVGALVFAAPGHVIDDAALADGLARCNATRTGSAAKITRARVLSEPPSIDHGEITDKGYINQRAVLARRAVEVEALYAGDCIVAGRG
ncbi:MAG: feruloyl-CoA synthase [Deltaproteobacteria bacterium]|nr:feruloyl-CoA synthase [Deltaproteobacteria bacterium]